MKKYEYRLSEYIGNAYVSWLNEQGAEGWLIASAQIEQNVGMQWGAVRAVVTFVREVPGNGDM